MVATPDEEGVVVAAVRRRVVGGAGRPRMRSPGRPPVARREHRQRFWAAIARGLSSEDAAVEAGVSPAVGVRWFREGGGMPSISLRPLSGRYLSFAEREEIAILQRAAVRGARDRPSAWASRRRRSRGSCAATPRPAAAGSSTGPRRRSGTPIGGRGGRRSAKLASERRAAAVRAGPARGRDRDAGRGEPVPGPDGALDRSPSRAPRRTAAGRARGARSRSPTGCGSTSPMMRSMRISHEAIYQSLYVQGRGALRRELTACLRTGRALRVPRARTRGRGKRLRHRRDHDQRAAGRGRGPGRARATGKAT